MVYANRTYAGRYKNIIKYWLKNLQESPLMSNFATAKA
jgi:hypothetical protein